MLVLMRGMGVLLFYDAPLRQPALVVRVRAAGTAHPPGRELYRAGGWRDREARRVWPHMLRHSCGYYLADQGTDLRTMQDYLGHRDPKHTAHYTRLPGIGSKACGSSLRPKPAVSAS